VAVPLSASTKPITEDADFIRAALEDAHVPSLLPTVAQLTGDLSLLRHDLRPDPTRIREPQGGLTDAQQAATRALVLEVLLRYRDQGSRPAPPPGAGELRRLMEFIVGGTKIDEYLPILQEEVGISGADRRAPEWHKDAVAKERPFLVAVIGAGMSGIVAAYRLRQAGIPCVVIEKNDDVGGTWFENAYPGCRVDVPSHLYSYSFAQKDDWPQHFSSQQVLLDYFRVCVDEFGVREQIRFSTEVVSAAFDEDRCLWFLHLRTPDGEKVLEAQALISAVGQLNRPNFPRIAGIESFAGASFHSAQWDPGVSLEGKKVAVVGTGCSGAQLIPVVAEEAAQLRIFQRTPNWMAATPDYHDDVAAGMLWLLGHVPSYSEWYRFWLFWQLAEGMLAASRVDPAWEHQDRSVSAANDEMRVLLAGYLESQFAEDPELLRRVTPTYPPGSKRVVRDNGIWAKTINRDNVRLVTDPIEAITPTGITTAGGQEHDADVIIYATGFQASRFLAPMKIVGRGGVDLHERWDGNARAYLGITVPGFPNFFCLYGPNTNIVANGSIIWFSECEVRYVVDCLRLLLEGSHRAMECKADVHDAYNVRIDEGNRRMAWGASSVNSWYKNDTGRVAQNWPFSLVEYWDQTRQVDPADYELR
jgi:4-hydroxyacetophenone monooxygenase